MAYTYPSGKTFEQILGDTGLSGPAPLKISKGFGTNDTRASKKQLEAIVDDAHLQALNRLSQKAACADVSKSSHLYMIEDTKSRADRAYEDKDYVVVTREDGHKPDFGLIASRI